MAVPEVKLFHLRPPRLKHSIADEFAQHIWGSDWKSSTIHHPTLEFHFGGSSRDLLPDRYEELGIERGRLKAKCQIGYRKEIPETISCFWNWILLTHSSIYTIPRFKPK